ncbi:translocation/assembly module TamB domain-containing protein [Tistrella mobilis]
MGLVVILIGGIGGAAIWADSEQGRETIAGLARDGIEAAGLGPVELPAIEGSLFGRLHLPRLRIGDPADPWLVADDVTFSWRPSALLAGRIEIATIAAERIKLAPPPDDGTPPPPSEPFDPRTVRLPDEGMLPPLSLDLRKLSVSLLELDPRLTGLDAPAMLGVDGAARIGRGDISWARLDVHRLDGPAGRVSAALETDLGTGRLDVDLVAEEAEGGLVATMADLPGRPPITARLEGSGPLEGWTGRLTAGVEGLADLETGIRLALRPDPSLQLQGELDWAGMGRALAGADAATPAGGDAPADQPVPPLVLASEAPLTFDLSVLQPDAQTLTIDRLALAAGGVMFSGTAGMDTGTGAVQARLTGSASGTAPILALAQPAALSAATLSLDVDGTWPAIDARLAATLAAPQLQGVGDGGPFASAARLTAAVTGRAPAQDLPADLDLALDLDLDGPRPAALGLPPEAADGVLSLKTRGSFDGAAGKVVIDAALLDIGTANLSATGSYALDDGTIDAQAGLSAEKLSRLATLAGLPQLAGTLGVDVTVTGNPASRLVADVSAEGRSMQLGIPEADAALAGRIDLATRVTVAGDGGITAENLSLATGTTRLAGRAALGAGGGLDGTVLNLAVRDLGRLAETLGAPAAGRLEADIALAGNLSDPAARVNARLADGRLGSIDVQRLTLDLDGRNLLSAPTGRVALDGATAEGPLRLTAEAASADGGKRLDVTALALDFAGTTARGQAAVTLANALVRGRLDINAPDLAPLGRLAGLDLGGRLSLDVDLGADRRGRQTVKADGEAAALSVAGSVSADRLTLDADMVLDQGRPGGRATVAAERVTAGPVQLATLQATATPEGAATAFALAATGNFKGRLTLDAGGNLATDRQGAMVLTLDRLKGQALGEELGLGAPATVRLADATRIDLPELRIGKAGRIVLDAVMAPDRVTAEGRLTAVPLDPLRRFQVPIGNGGRLDGTLDLALGPRGREGRVGLTIRDLPVDAEVEGMETPVISGDIDATLGDRVADLDLSIAGLGEQPLTITAKAPLQPFRRGAPTDIALDEAGPVEGRLRWQGDLGRLALAAGIDGQRFAGRIDADMTVNGTIADPDVAGGIRLRDAAYENQDVGTLLTGITGEIGVSGRCCLSVKLDARDGGSGTVAVNGTVNLQDLADPRMDINVKIDQARLVRRDDVDAVVDGNLAMTGGLGDGQLGGTVTVRQAEVRLISTGGPSVRTIDVVEVRNGRVVADPGSPEQQQQASGGLALNIDVRAPGRIFVRGRGLDTEWEGDLKVRGTTSTPVINGDLRVVRGEADVVGRTLTFSKGIITFDGLTEIDPRLDIEATLTNADVTAIVQVTGRASAPQLTLTSEPALAQDEILARAFFGKPGAKLSAMDAIRVGQGLATLTGGGGGGFDPTGFARDLFGLDVLDVGTDDTGTGASVRAGKYLSDDLFVGVEQGAGSSAVTVELEVLPNIKIDTEVGAEGGSSVGATWSYDY